jgi:hypothetical protein
MNLDLLYAGQKSIDSAEPGECLLVYNSCRGTVRGKCCASAVVRMLCCSTEIRALPLFGLCAADWTSRLHAPMHLILAAENVLALLVAEFDSVVDRTR